MVGAIALALLALLIVSLITACGPRGESLRPTSSLSEADALKIAMNATASRELFVRRVAGSSMEPIIYGNAVIIYERCSMAQARVGDLILRKTGTGKLVLHRCIARTETRLTLKGANNQSSDDFVTDTDLVGRYVGHIVFDPDKPLFQ